MLIYLLLIFNVPLFIILAAQESNLQHLIQTCFPEQHVRTSSYSSYLER